METLASMQFGSRARAVAVHAVVNEHVDYRGLYEALQARVDAGDDASTGLRISVQRLQAEAAGLRAELERERAAKLSAQGELRAVAASCSMSLEAARSGGGGGDVSAVALIESLQARWAQELAALSERHAGEMEALRARMHEQLLAQQHVTEEACEKRNAAEFAASATRDELLDALRVRGCASVRLRRVA
jgi:hypothetical protein